MINSEKYLTVVDFDGDEVALNLCVANWGNGRGVTESALAKVTTLGSVFTETEVMTTSWLRFFTKLREIGGSAFKSCAYLEHIILPDNIIRISGDNSFISCTKVKEIVLPQTIVDIKGRFSFQYCGSAASDITPLDLNLPSLNLSTSAGVMRQFADCPLVHSVVSLGISTVVSQRMFERCTNLVSAILPSTVTELRGDCFLECKKLKTLEFRGNTPPANVNSYAFRNCSSSGTLIVPHGASANYANLPTTWGNVANWTVVEADE